MPEPLSARQVVAQYRAAKQGKHICTGEWTKAVLSPDEFFHWFRACMVRRINAHLPNQVGRNHSPDYDLALDRLRPYVGSRLVIDRDRVYGLPARIGQALSHRIRQPGDY